jgi:threonine/homoserine/homoserine lactone efflux protein
MNSILLVLAAYVMGFLTAIPPGATQIEIAKRAFDDKLHAAYMVVIASALSDVMYGCIALFGIAPFMQYRIVQAVFWMGGTAVLAVLAVVTFHRVSQTQDPEVSMTDEFSSRLSVSFVTGFSLAVTNPIMIFWWLGGSRIILDIHIVEKFNLLHTVLFLVAGGLGLASYLSTFAHVLKWAKRFLSQQSMRKITIGMGVAFVVLAIYFLVRSLETTFG